MSRDAPSLSRDAPGDRLGWPRLHLRRCDSTNQRARELARAGAPHGTLVTAAEQLSGRGRQGRTWHAPAGRALLLSLVLGNWPELLSLAAAVAVAELAGAPAQIKWPNDVLLHGAKLSGILVEGRPREGWVVLGIGVNAAVDLAELPADLRGTAATLGRSPEALQPLLGELLSHLQRWLDADREAILGAVRDRDALRGREIRFDGGRGVACGIDDRGRLLVSAADGQRALAAGEVHLGQAATSTSGG